MKKQKIGEKDIYARQTVHVKICPIILPGREKVLSNYYSLFWFSFFFNIYLVNF